MFFRPSVQYGKKATGEWPRAAVLSAVSASSLVMNVWGPAAGAILYLHLHSPFVLPGEWEAPVVVVVVHPCHLPSFFSGCGLTISTPSLISRGGGGGGGGEGASPSFRGSGLLCVMRSPLMSTGLTITTSFGLLFLVLSRSPRKKGKNDRATNSVTMIRRRLSCEDLMSVGHCSVCSA